MEYISINANAILTKRFFYKMKAIINIGTEKTGTSSLQYFLMVNRANLMEQGFYFMESTGTLDDRRLSAYCYDEKKFDDFHKINLITTRAEKEVFESQLEENIEAEIKNLPETIHTVIFSSEHFHSRVKKSSEIKKLKDLLCRFFISYQVICYLRPQIEMSISLYSTALKNHATHSLNQHIKQCNPKNDYYNYEKLLSLWSTEFNDHQLDVRLFIKEELVNNDVLADFCEQVGLKFSSLQSIEPRNESVTPTGQEMLKVVNANLPSFIEGVGKNKVKSALVEWVSRHYAGQGVRPEIKIISEIQSEFDELNEIVRKQWFPEREKLFNDIDYLKLKTVEQVDEEQVDCFRALVENKARVWKNEMQVKLFIQSEEFKTCLPITENNSRLKKKSVNKLSVKNFISQFIRRILK